MHAYMHTHMHACMNTCMHTCMHACICMPMHAYACICMHARVHACNHACMHMHAYGCICMHAPTTRPPSTRFSNPGIIFLIIFRYFQIRIERGLGAWVSCSIAVISQKSHWPQESPPIPPKQARRFPKMACAGSARKCKRNGFQNLLRSVPLLVHAYNNGISYPVSAKKRCPLC